MAECTKSSNHLCFWKSRRIFNVAKSKIFHVQETSRSIRTRLKLWRMAVAINDNEEKFCARMGSVLWCRTFEWTMGSYSSSLCWRIHQQFVSKIHFSICCKICSMLINRYQFLPIFQRHYVFLQSATGRILQEFEQWTIPRNKQNNSVNHCTSKICSVCFNRSS